MSTARDDVLLRPAALATATVFALNGTVISAWVARLPATRDRLDLDPRAIGLTLLMGGLGSLVAMPFVGRLVARYSSRRVVLVASTATGCMLVLLAVTPGVVATGLALFAFGAGLGSWDVAMNVQGSHLDRSAGRDWMPRYHACWSVGAVLGAALGAASAAAGLPLVVHFAFAAFLAVVPTVLVVHRWYVDDSEPASDAAAGTPAAQRLPLLTRRILLLGTIALCGALLEGSAADWLALYLHDDRGQVQATAALGYATFAVAMAVSRFAGTPVIAWRGRPAAIRLAGAAAAVGVAAVLVLPGAVGAFLGVALWGLGTALVFPAAMSASGEQPGRAADAIAAISTIGYGGFLVGPPLIGLLAQNLGLGNALWVLVPLGVAIALLAPVVAPPRPAD